jgi:glycosyltransferase involved in cell wall biosynthesis
MIRALIADGFEIIAVAPRDEYVEKLCALGLRYVSMPMDNKGTSPLRDLGLLLRFYGFLRHERPVAYLGYTIKPNIYGSLAAQSLGIPVINNIAGLGATFIRTSWLTQVAKLLYRLALGRSRRVFFQNQADRALFLAERLVREMQTGLLPGSGVDLARFTPLASRPADGQLRFLLVARMLWDKGVGEFIEAARRVRQTNPEARFQLLGFLDVLNPAAIDRSVVEGWVAEGLVEYLGVAEDVRPHLAAADCVVLPSYREGLSRSLIEAAAMGRPLIATDVPGCRELIEEGINGFLAEARDAGSLAHAIATFCNLSDARREDMGAASRRKAMAEFDEAVVVDHYRRELAEIVH